MEALSAVLSRRQDGAVRRGHAKLPHPGSLLYHYRRALSASVVAHAGYIAAQGEPSLAERQILDKKFRWQALEARKNALHARLLQARTEGGPTRSE